MIPEWLIPSKAPNLHGTIRDHRINRTEDDRADKHSVNVSKGMIDKEATAKKHAEWKALYAVGKTPQEIADQYGVYASTVRRITGGSFRRPGRITRKIKIDGKVYDSQVSAIHALRIGREKLIAWIQTGKAKYV